MTAEKIAVVYGRVSTADQQNSLNAQDAKMLDYARFKGLTIEPWGVLFDEDTSGSVPIGERERGAEMLAALSEGRARHLIVTKLDRLGRNAVDLQNVWRYLTVDLGITVHVIDLGGESFSSNSPVSRFIVGMMSLFAELDRENIRSRIIDVFDHKFAIGEAIGPDPFGWMGQETNRKSKKGKPIFELVEHPEEMPVLKQILFWRYVGTLDADGSCGPWSLKRIASELNRLRRRTKRHGQIAKKTGLIEGRWTKFDIQSMLRNRHVRRLTNVLYPEPREQWAIKIPVDYKAPEVMTC